MTPIDYLPHRGPMVLLDTVERVDLESAVCTATVRADHPFAVGGRVPLIVGIEWIAQTVAVHVGHAAVAEGMPIRIGYLLGTREMDLARDYVEVGETLRIEVRRLLGDRTLATYAGTIDAGESRVVVASVNVYQEDA